MLCLVKEWGGWYHPIISRQEWKFRFIIIWQRWKSKFLTWPLSPLWQGCEAMLQTGNCGLLGFLLSLHWQVCVVVWSIFLQWYLAVVEWLLWTNSLSCKAVPLFILWLEKRGFSWTSFLSVNVGICALPTSPTPILRYVRQKENPGTSPFCHSLDLEFPLWSLFSKFKSLSVFVLHLISRNFHCT